MPRTVELPWHGLTWYMHQTLIAPIAPIAGCFYVILGNAELITRFSSSWSAIPHIQRGVPTMRVLQERSVKSGNSTSKTYSSPDESRVFNAALLSMRRRLSVDFTGDQAVLKTPKPFKSRP